MVDLHPYQPEDSLQGMLQLLHELQHMLAGDFRARRGQSCSRLPEPMAS